MKDDVAFELEKHRGLRGEVFHDNNNVFNRQYLLNLPSPMNGS